MPLLAPVKDKRVLGDDFIDLDNVEGPVAVEGVDDEGLRKNNFVHIALKDRYEFCSPFLTGYAIDLSNFDSTDSTPGNKDRISSTFWRRNSVFLRTRSAIDCEYFPYERKKEWKKDNNSHFSCFAFAAYKEIALVSFISTFDQIIVKASFVPWDKM